jgi:hypothetical protein
MEKSKLEALSDRILSQFFIQLRKIYDEELSNSPYNPLIKQYSFTDACDTVSNMFGVAPCDYIDLDYILTIIETNRNINEGVITKRPKIGGYTFDIDVHENVSQRVTYKHQSESYSPSTLLQIVKKMEYEGDINVWDGELVDTDIYESEINDIEYDKDSITKIR